MTIPAAPPAEARVRDWLVGVWSRHRTVLLGLALLLMIAAAVHRLSNEFGRLLLEPGPTGGSDLRRYHEAISAWFAGEPTYGRLATAIHAPATYAVLWPLLGPFSFGQARWLWAGLYVLALVWLIRQILAETAAKTVLERACLALFPLAVYASAAAIGNGQLSVLTLPALLAGTLLLARSGGWRTDLAGAGLVLATLASPTVAAPFFWLMVFVPGRLRPAALVLGGYAALTLLAAGFQPEPVLALLGDWTAAATAAAERGAAGGGYANLTTWLVAAGLSDWSALASLLVLGLLGAWVYLHRGAGIWPLLGVTAIVARMWTYHRLYDDLLVLVAMVAVHRALTGTSGQRLDARWRTLAGGTLLVAWIGLMAPARLLVAGPPWSALMMTGQTVAWLALLGLLLRFAAECRPAAPVPAAVALRASG